MNDDSTSLPEGVFLVDKYRDASINSPEPERKMYACYLEDNTVLKVQREIDRLAASSKSKVITEDQWQQRVDAVKSWNNQTESVDGIPFCRKSFRRNNKQGYQWIKDFTVDTNQAGNDLLFRNEPPSINNGVARQAAHSGNIFNILMSSHVIGLCHMKSDRVWQDISSRYYNIPRTLIKYYCQVCPICLGDNPKIKPQKGAVKPITSHHFRDRFQIDLCDFREDPQIWPGDETQTEYRWLLVVKDHFTKFMVGHELVSKSPTEVARALYKIYSIIGFPLIQHTDNGNEFVASQVTELLNEIAPGSRTLTGKTRTPRHQGSIERGNKSLKNSIGSSVQDNRKAGVRHASWLTEYPRVLSGLNSSCNRGNDVPPYALLFGMDFVNTEYTRTTKNDIINQDSILERCTKEGSAYTEKMILLDEIDEHTVINAANTPTSSQKADVTLEVTAGKSLGL